MRWNEARLATWGDVDLDQALIVVRPENAKSGRERVIPLRQGLVERIHQLRRLHEDDLGLPCGAGDRVFLSPDAAPWKRPTTNAMRIFTRVLKAAGIPKIDQQGQRVDIHALRHAAASRMARAGVPLVHAQRILGHSSPVLTARIYTHASAEDLRASVERLPAVGV